MVALIIVASILVSFLISHLIVIYVIFHKFYHRMSIKKIDEIYGKNRLYDEKREEIYQGKDFLLSESSKVVTITSFDDLKLVGHYYDYGNKKCIIMLHGAHSDPYLVFGVQAKRFVRDGYNILLVEQRAHGESEGKYMTYGKYEADDLLKWVSFAKDDLKIDEVILYGMSMGATSIMVASPKLDKNYVKAIIADCGYTSVDELIRHLVSTQKIPSFLFLGGVGFLAKHLAKVSFKDFYTPDILKNNEIPTFFISGTLDSVASKQFLIDNYNNCASRKDYLFIEGAGHTLAMVNGGENAYSEIIKFIEEGD